MHLLGNIASSGNPQLPNKIPEHLNIAETDWIPYSDDSKIKNQAYIANWDSEIEQRTDTVPDYRLNHFNLFNELLDDLEADRKGACQKIGGNKKSQKKNKKADRNTADFFQNFSFEKISENSQGIK